MLRVNNLVGFGAGNIGSDAVGIALVNTGGGSGTWQRINSAGNAISVDSDFFDQHPIWGGIQDETIDSQSMVRIPKFYIKVGTLPSGTYAGKKAWIISSQPIVGGNVHPAFMDSETEVDQIWVGKYEASADGTKIASVPGVLPLTATTLGSFKGKAQARNIGGITGFHQITIYEISAIQMLSLIELGTPNIQTAIAGASGSTSLRYTGATPLVYRGIYELWGNTYCLVDGLRVTTSGDLQVFDNNGYNTYVTVEAGLSGTYKQGWPVTMSESSGTDCDCKSLFIGGTFDYTETNGSFADYQLFEQNSSIIKIPIHGGGRTVLTEKEFGLFCLYCNIDETATHTVWGGRLSKK